MFTSAKSSRTALLWGDRWWIEGSAEPIVFGELHRAAEVLLEHVTKPCRLRLIFQPNSLAAFGVDCPKGSRETLRLALGEQFPALHSADLAWGFEPIVGGHNQFATVLYHETQSGLFALAQALQHAGIQIEGAWPLATILNLVPEDWPDSGALTVTAVAENQTLVYRHTPDGKRAVQAELGIEAEPLAMATLRDTLARADSAFYVVGLDGTAERLVAQLPPLDVPRLRLLAWPALAAAAKTVSHRQPAQLLPSPAFVNAERSVLVAGFVALIVALGFAGDYAYAELSRRQADAANAREITALRAEIDRRKTAQAELAALRAAVQAGETATAIFSPWLRSLGTKLPREVVLTTLRVDRDGFSIAGGVGSQAKLAEPPWREWLSTIAPPQGGWTLPESPAVPTADFRLTGRARL